MKDDKTSIDIELPQRIAERLTPLVGDPDSTLGDWVGAVLEELLKDEEKALAILEQYSKRGQ